MARLWPRLPVSRAVADLPPPTEELRASRREFWDESHWRPWPASPFTAVAPSIGAIPMRPTKSSRSPEVTGTLKQEKRFQLTGNAPLSECVLITIEKGKLGL